MTLIETARRLGYTLKEEGGGWYLLGDGDAEFSIRMDSLEDIFFEVEADRKMAALGNSPEAKS